MAVEAYRTVIESLGEATLIISGKGLVLAWNNAAVRLLGNSALAAGETYVQELTGAGGEPVDDYLQMAAGSRQPLLAVSCWIPRAAKSSSEPDVPY